jgi:hypothetical protein
MGKIRRGNYVFVFWAGDHSPAHVHVYRDSVLIVKWDLQNEIEMEGKANAQIKRFIHELQNEGKL